MGHLRVALFSSARRVSKIYWRSGLVRVVFDASKGVVDAGLTLTHFGGGKANGLLALMLTLNSWRLECCLLYTSPSPRDGLLSRMPSSA